ncbi:hypothetical protein [Thiothrix subterranea]|uniref:hypothetical protein n=1 Tax=Thiothrix subterranea TaxID=2735563 RepID=UPI00280A6162|nr:hypothetical protein [Thiothrix subterranea]
MNKNNLKVALAWLAGFVLAGILIFFITHSAPVANPAAVTDSPSLLQMLKSGFSCRAE